MGQADGGVYRASTIGIMRPLIISLLTTGIEWSVVWSDGRRAETHDFSRHGEAEKFFKHLADKNPHAIRFVEGKLV